jgi:FkbM family methyltransferase
MSEAGILRTVARSAKLTLVRALQGAALRLSSPFDFMNAVQERLREPALRDYMASRGGCDLWIDSLFALAREDAALRDYLANRGGADRLLGRLYDIAVEDEALRYRIVEGEVGSVFRTLYPKALADKRAGEYLASRGIDDLYKYVHAMAGKAGLPLAEQVASFGQESEDLILARMFDRQDKGFYVDVGAHHPFRFSNTWLLYRRGWRGINIDAMPGTMEAFRRWRPEDVNLECLVSSDTAPRTFFQYDEPALNTVSEELVRKREVDAPHYRLVGQVTLQARRLADILADHAPPGRSIDVLNVDVEGHDLDVLSSNDWQRFRPKVIVAELIGTDFAEMEASPLYRFLADRGYRLQSKLVNSAIFVS